MKLRGKEERGREKRGEGTREHGWVVGGRKVKEGLERGDYAKSGCCLWLLRYRFPIPAFSALYILSTPIRVWYGDDAEAITGIPGDERCYYWGVAPLADVGSCEIQRERERERTSRRSLTFWYFDPGKPALFARLSKWRVERCIPLDHSSDRYNRIMRENGYGKCKRVGGGGVEFDREFLLLVDIQLIG